MISRGALFLSCLIFSLIVVGQTSHKATITILYQPGHPANQFKPAEAIGAAFDGHWQGEIEHIMTDRNIKAMQSVGLKPISYRLRTELGGEVWHWNPNGTWSDPKHQQGYWVSDSNPQKPIQLSNGYFLPRRGNTHDQANDNGYSRIDDGDTSTYWKSNPYLDHYFTHDPDSLHPQWVVVDLGAAREVNALRILWADPYALSYSVDYASDIGKDYFEPYQPGLWHSFTHSHFRDRKGGNELIILSEKPVKARFVRISFYQSSYTTKAEYAEIRDRMGFAIREIYTGYTDQYGRLHDQSAHDTDNTKQSVIHVSSTDPWHRARDIDVNTEQVGIDRFFASGLTNGHPAMLPIGLLYDTPENMTSLLHYVQRRHYPVSDWEMGEEPEGQLFHPDDYGALYLQWAQALRQKDPQIRLGGPCFAALAKDKAYGDSYTFSEREWTSGFIKYLKEHNSLNTFNFFSTEWYPFDDICASPAPQLLAQPQLMYYALKPFKEHILPPNTDIYVTEYGYSAYGGKPEVTIEGALMYADILGQFLTLGGTKSYLYGYEPTSLEQTNGCDWGNNMLFGMDDDGKIVYRTAAYYGMQIMARYWATPDSSLLKVYPARTHPPYQDLISAYALLRPDHTWSIAILNKSPRQTFDVRIMIDQAQHLHELQSSSAYIQYSGEQYHWKSAGSRGFPDKSLLPVQKKLKSGAPVRLLPYSLTVINY
jgi:F5/8 type C domain